MAKTVSQIADEVLDKVKYATWVGYSNKSYIYVVHSLPFSCPEEITGNYIFAKWENSKWTPLYIGQGILNDRTNDEDHYKCAVGKDATHIHVRLNSIEKVRKFEEGDLLQVNQKAYSPIGCNKKEGG
jgi:hypothetical protein